MQRCIHWCLPAECTQEASASPTACRCKCSLGKSRVCLTSSWSTLLGLSRLLHSITWHFWCATCVQPTCKIGLWRMYCTQFKSSHKTSWDLLDLDYYERHKNITHPFNHSLPNHDKSDVFCHLDYLLRPSISIFLRTLVLTEKAYTYGGNMTIIIIVRQCYSFYLLIGRFLAVYSVK